jgi:hypothetical protein
MPDQSELDAKYFVDGSRYNCPFCNRRHVVFRITYTHDFDWTDSKTCRVIFVKCASCDKESMHLSFITGITHWVAGQHQVFNPGLDIDDAIFYSVPSSFFVIDKRVPKELRELMTEAEGCLKSNFLTGASACARKIVYELALKWNAEGDHYEHRIKSLKAKLPTVDPTYFDTLLTIQEVTSDKVHEASFDGWDGKHLKVILASLAEILHEIYVEPAVREARRQAIIALKTEVFGGEQGGHAQE